MSEAHVAEPSVESRLETFLSRIELSDVRFVKVFGEFLDDESQVPSDPKLNIAAGFRFVNETLMCRIDVDLPIRVGADEGAARMALGLILSFSAAGVKEPDQELMTLFVTQSAFFMAAPYFREAIQSMSQRLGLPAVTVGLFRSDHGGLNINIRTSEPHQPSPTATGDSATAP